MAAPTPAKPAPTTITVCMRESGDGAVVGMAGRKAMGLRLVPQCGLAKV